jgi:hypothetical protein
MFVAEDPLFESLTPGVVARGCVLPLSAFLDTMPALRFST